MGAKVIEAVVMVAEGVPVMAERVVMVIVIVLWYTYHIKGNLW